MLVQYSSIVILRFLYKTNSKHINKVFIMLNAPLFIFTFHVDLYYTEPLPYIAQYFLSISETSTSSSPTYAHVHTFGFHISYCTLLHYSFLLFLTVHKSSYFT